MSPEAHDPELAALAQALAALAPTAGRLDRDQLLFRAGQASLGRRAWLWPSLTAVLAVLVGAVGLSEVLRPAPQRVQCIIYQRVEPPLSPANRWAGKQAGGQDAALSTTPEFERQAAPLSYLRLQRLVSAWGVDALPNPLPVASARSNAAAPVLSRNQWFGMQNP